MLNLEIGAVDLERLIAELHATDEQARKALNSTMGRMAKWLRTRSIRDLSGKLKVQQKILRRRAKTFRFQGGFLASGSHQKVWYGLNPIPWIQLHPRATRKGGVSADGGRHDPHAFVADYKGRKQVLRRAGKARFPLEVVSEDIHEDATDYIEDFVIASLAFERQFMKTFEHELRWRTSTQA